MNIKPENKEIMEKVFKSNKIDGANGKMINGDNTETITYNTYNIFYPEVTTKNEYSEFYYKYINKFEELEGYLFSNLFWCFITIWESYYSLGDREKRFSYSIVRTISKRTEKRI